MSRKPLIWMLAPLLLAALYGCPKKKPQTAEPSVEPQTGTVTSPPPTAAAPPPSASGGGPGGGPVAVERPAGGQRRAPAPRLPGQTSTSATTSRRFPTRAGRDWPVNADLMRDNPQLQLLIEGHADERGTNEYNLALGERRSNAAKDYLASLGVSDARLRTLSYGQERPVCIERRGELLVAEPPRPHGGHRWLKRRLRRPLPREAGGTSPASR